MNPTLIDAHTHIQFSAYDSDREEAIKRSLDKGIWMINSGSNSINSTSAVMLAEKYEEGVYATVGLHPSHAGEPTEAITEDSGYEVFDYEAMKRLAFNDKVVGVGECGFDFFRRDRSYEENQREVFVAQIMLAEEVKKPVVIHCREAYKETYEVLSANRSRLLNDAGIMHFYSGTKEDAGKFLDLGFSFTFGGAITLPKKADGADFAELLRYLPKERIMFETDAPYVAPIAYRGKRNEPAYVEEVALAAAEILGMSFDEARLMATENTRRVFGI